jgi:xanthosine utilization system XapX-like protein
MELPAPALLAGVFLAGVLVGYTIRAFISARRRARTRTRRHDFE